MTLMPTITSEQVMATMESIIVVCQCGCTVFNVDSKTKTAVSLSCAKCGDKTSVKGPVALANVPSTEIMKAVKTPVMPDPDYEPKKATSKKSSEAEQGAENEQKYTMLRFRVGIEAKNNVIDKAMEAVRIMNCADSNFRAQTWQGHALEFLCADFLSGCDPSVLAVVNEMDEAVKAAVEQAESEDKKPTVVSRKARDVRLKTLEQGAARLGIIEQKVQSPSRTPRAPKEKDADDRVRDNGMLKQAVQKALISYAEEYRADTGDTIGLMINVTVADAVKRSNRDGGFVVKVVGDERTRNVGRQTPITYFWMSMEPQGRELELVPEYSSVLNEKLQDAQLQIVELLPANWNELSEDQRWEMPSFCTDRIIMEG